MKNLARLVHRTLLIFSASVVLIGGGMALDIWRYGNERSDGPADAALVLGAAVIGDAPSPVLQERLRHAADLYARGRVTRIVVSGGRSPEDDASEAQAGRWAEDSIVPPTRSDTSPLMGRLEGVMRARMLAPLSAIAPRTASEMRPTP